MIFFFVALKYHTVPLTYGLRHNTTNCDLIIEIMAFADGCDSSQAWWAIDRRAQGRRHVSISIFSCVSLDNCEGMVCKRTCSQMTERDRRSHHLTKTNKKEQETRRQFWHALPYLSDQTCGNQWALTFMYRTSALSSTDPEAASYE